MGVYCRELISHLGRDHDQVRWLLAYRPHRLWRGWRDPDRPASSSVRVLWDRRPFRRVALFHGLNQRMPEARYPRSVCTFHDLFVLTADYSTADFKQRFAAQARHAAERADLIITVSRFTGEQVHQLLNVPWSRIRVVPHGVRFPATDAVFTEAGREPLVLSVGAIQTRKNLTRLVQAFEASAPPPWRLVLAGSKGYGWEQTWECIEQSPARDRIEVPDWVDDQQLASLYRRASIFAFPSLDEGFGIPVLEAMAQGVPVLAGDRSALPEVCGDAALLVDPLSVDALSGALHRMMADTNLREQLRSRGRERARQFSWEQAARATWRVYEELL